MPSKLQTGYPAPAQQRVQNWYIPSLVCLGLQINMLKDDLRKQEEAATAARQEAANFQAERDIERQKAERREADLARADEWRKSLDEREMRQQASAGWLCQLLCQLLR